MMRLSILLMLSATLVACATPDKRPRMGKCQHPMFGLRDCEMDASYEDIGSNAVAHPQLDCVLADAADGLAHWYCPIRNK